MKLARAQAGGGGGMLLGSKVFQKDVTIITLMRRILPADVQVGEHAHLYECMPKLTLGTS